MLSRWSWLHLQLLAPINLHWASMVGYGPFSLCVIHKDGLCLSSGDIDWLMIAWIHVHHDVTVYGDIYPYHNYHHDLVSFSNIHLSDD
jgi:hypothetical protein